VKPSIHFFTEDLEFKLKQKKILKSCLCFVASSHKKRIEELNYIFCSDNYLHSINLQYLNHDTYTDIITFDNSIDEEIIGDIFISVERVIENAIKFNVTKEEELFRVMSHGLLHLCGYKDKKKDEKLKMTEAENKALMLFQRNLKAK
jgi:rRNA maturation RNase YbeY